MKILAISYTIWRRSNSLFIKVGKCLIHSRVSMFKHFWDIHWNGQDLGYVYTVEGLSKGVDGWYFDFLNGTDWTFRANACILEVRDVNRSINVDHADHEF